jgi:hypothetical protein
MQVYTTLLPATALPNSIRESIRENLMQLIQLHDGLLGSLYEIIPHSEYNHKHAKEPPTFQPKTHIRWNSSDGCPGKDRAIGRFNSTRLKRKLRHSTDTVRPAREGDVASATDPKTAGTVARLFQKHVRRAASTWATCSRLILAQDQALPSVRRVCCQVRHDGSAACLDIQRPVFEGDYRTWHRSACTDDRIQWRSRRT